MFGLKLGPISEQVQRQLQQQSVVRLGGRMEHIAILRMGEFLLITVQVDMHDRLAIALQENLSEQIVKYSSRGVLIDISALEVVDSFIGRMLGSIAGISRVLDAETVVVGMQPAVAITLVELGLSLRGIRTALNVERGMEILRREAAVARYEVIEEDGDEAVEDGDAG